MNNFNRNKDLTQIFDEKWRANYGNNEKVSQAKKDFNKRMFGIRDKEEIRKEMREHYSVGSQVERLNQRMNSAIPKGGSISSGGNAANGNSISRENFRSNANRNLRGNF